MKTCIRFLLFLLLAIGVGACTSYIQAKDLTVSASLQVDSVETEALASCTWELLRETSGYLYHHNYDAVRGKWFIVAEHATIMGTSTGTYSHSVSFEDGGSSTLVEIRSPRTIWGTQQVSFEKIFNMVRECQEALTP